MLGALKQASTENWQKLLEHSPQVKVNLNNNEQIELQKILGLSDYITTQLCANPDWVMWLFNNNLKQLDRREFTFEIKAILSDVTDENQAKFLLRNYRNKQMVRLAWRDFMGYSTLEDSLLDLSELAEALIINARDWLYAQLSQQLGVPCDSNGNPQSLMILGMGKLGGRELNFSSDIDLIFTFPEHGETQGGRRPLDNQQFFIRMGQRLVALLGQITVDGFVFRVDMRLRPYGDSGPLVVSYSALEDYYQEQGRDWERYAMVKARVLGEKNTDAKTLQALLRPFIYRRYIDFSAIESLRKMKQLIAQEVRRRQLTNNIKLGAGGIREVEFVVQSFQLIRGGREPALRCQSLLNAIDTLYKLGQIEYVVVDELKQGYLLLRRVENLLQAIADQQTQTLPETDLDWQRLYVTLGYTDKISLITAINQAMEIIHEHFNVTVSADDEDNNSWTYQLWFCRCKDDGESLLNQHGVEVDFWNELVKVHDVVSQRSIGPRGRDTLDKLMPKLLEELIQQPEPKKAFQAIIEILGQILTRTTYLELLCENVGARQQLIQLCSVSPWIGSQLAKFPMLLDELIDPVQLFDINSLDDYSSELRQYLLRVPEDDMEQQMEALRQFKLAQQLKIAAADITGVLPMMQVSDHLTFLAEAIIEQVVQQAWQQISERFGIPANLAVGETSFAVIGYGKLGGIELGYGSDLDLVFIYKNCQGQTNGEKQIDASHFYLKLAQRVLHLFSTRTMSGELYEIDMRLRPSGVSGLLVSEISHFEEYQQNEAWVWEHQALVRARLVFGDTVLAQQFNQIRLKVLQKNRDPIELATQVRNMRQKMREHLLHVNEGMFDLKQSAGGIADIEFIAQYLVLNYAESFPELCFWSDNVRIFESLVEHELIEIPQAEQLTQAYCFLRDKNHKQTLSENPSLLSIEKVSYYTKPVVSIYKNIFG